MVPMRAATRTGNTTPTTRPPDPRSNPLTPSSTSAWDTQSDLEFELSGPIDQVPMGQPDTSLTSTASNRDPFCFVAEPVDLSVDSTLSQTSTTTSMESSPYSDDVSLPDEFLADSDEVGAHDQPRLGVNPGQLNDAWRTFFRDSLVAANRDQIQNAPLHAQPGGTPVSLPPPLRTAPNQPCGDPFERKHTDSFQLWSVNANGIFSRD
jgi:hypothetical protein